MRRCFLLLLVLLTWVWPLRSGAQVDQDDLGEQAEPGEEERKDARDDDASSEASETPAQAPRDEPYDYYQGETRWDAELGDEELVWDAKVESRASSVKESIKEDKKKGGLLKAEKEETTAEDLEATSLAEPSTVSLADTDVEVPEDVKLPGRLGPVRIYIGDSKDWIRIGLVTQLEYEHEQLLAGAGQDGIGTNELQFRRIRTVLGSSFLDGRIRSQLQLNLSPQALELIDLWLAFTRFRFASVRAGQFKIPFTRYRAQSFNALSFSDWSPVTRMYGGERQFGFEVLASAGIGKLEYALGMFTGQNARGSHAVGLEEYYGETPANPSALGDGFTFTQFDPALVGRLAKNIGQIDTDTNTDLVGGPLRQSLGLSIAWTARADVTQDLPLRLAFEWLGKVRHFDFNAVAYLAWFERWADGKLRYGSFGLLAEAGYRISTLFELATRYSLIYYSNTLQDDAGAYAEFQIDNAEDPELAAIRYAGVGELIARHELALAGSAHIIGNSLKLIGEFDWIPFRVEQGRQNALAFTMQLQFMF